MLRYICNRHPEMAITMEFACLTQLGIPYRRHASWILSRARETRIAFDFAFARKRQIRLRNSVFALRYAVDLLPSRGQIVSPLAVEAAYRKLFPGAKIVGDKWPDYVFDLERLAEFDALRCVIIYRDCRDVVSSTLRMVRTNWKGRPWTAWMDTPEKVAQRWVRAIRIMKRSKERVYALQYEQLVRNPGETLAELGEWLGVDPAGFPTNTVDESNIGKFEQELGPGELELVLNVAAPVMQELGYEL